MNRKKLILFILLVVLALSIGYSFIRMPRQQTVSQLKNVPAATTPPPARKSPAGRVVENRVRLDLLDREASRFSGFRRNIFRPIFHEEVKPGLLPPVLPKPVPPPPLPQQKQPVASVPSLPPGPPPEIRDIPRFTFLGFLQKDSKKTIFLSKDKEILLVKAGDKFGGKYEATNITNEALTIRVLSDGSEVVIPLVDGKPLTVPPMR